MANQTLGVSLPTAMRSPAKTISNGATCSLDGGPKYRAIFFGLHAWKPNSHRESPTPSSIFTTQLVCAAAIDSDAERPRYILQERLQFGHRRHAIMKLLPPDKFPTPTYKLGK